MRENLGAIGRYIELLGQGRATAIFPEGVSQDSLQLAPVRSGAARIALGAEAAGDFTLGLRLVPVGLQFEPRRKFRGEAFVRFGKPILVADLASLYSTRPREALGELTGRIRNALEDLAVHVDRGERAWLVERLSEVYYARIRRTGLLATGRRGLEGELRYRMAACLNYFSETDEEVVREVERSLVRYDRLREAAGVRRRLIEEPSYLLSGALAPVQAGLEILIGFVPALFGLLTGGPPYLLTRSLARRLASRNRHLPSLSILHILIGAVAFPVVWGLWTYVAWRFTGARVAVILAALVVPTGLYALFFAHRAAKLAVHLSGRAASLMKLGDVARVREAQTTLMGQMDAARARYIREVFGQEGSLTR
jgi:hypothetical protein